MYLKKFPNDDLFANEFTEVTQFFELIANVEFLLDAIRVALWQIDPKYRYAIFKNYCTMSSLYITLMSRYEQFEGMMKFEKEIDGDIEILESHLKVIYNDARQVLTDKGVTIKFQGKADHELGFE